MRTGSSPESGSSQSSTVGSSTSERARPARFFIPPESSARREVVGLLETDRLEVLHDDLAHLLVAQVGVLAKREGDVVVDTHRAEQGAVLEHHADVPAQAEDLRAAHLAERAAVDEDLARVGPHEAEDVLDHHALAGAGRAEDHRCGALGNLQVDALEHRVGAEALVEILGLDREQVRLARMAVHGGVDSPAHVRRNGLGAYGGHLSRIDACPMLTPVHTPLARTLPQSRDAYAVPRNEHDRTFCLAMLTEPCRPRERSFSTLTI